MLDRSVKQCSYCGVQKPVTDFHKRPSGNSWHSYCKPCVRWYHQRWRQVNKHSERVGKRRWYAANPGKRRAQDWRRRGIKFTWEEYQAMLVKQDNKCALCLLPEGGASRMETFALDHDHASGKVRGILHRKCNAALGLLNDDCTVLQRAIEYLKGVPGNNVKARPRKVA